MNYSKINDCDIANGPGCRVTLFVSGCTNHCRNCFQPQTWDFGYGQPFTKATEDELMALLRPAYIRGLTLLGGEPMEPSNQMALVPFLRRVRRELPDKDVWCYTGFNYEELTDENHPKHTDVTQEMISMLDVLVDGKFIDELKDPTLWFRGSSNQRVINIRATREKHAVVLMADRDRKLKRL